VPTIFEQLAPGDKSRLCDHYERLRDYILSSGHAPLQPLGLDLWIKGGALSWIEAMLPKAPPGPASCIAPKAGNASISADFVLSLVNILIERRGNDGLN